SVPTGSVVLSGLPSGNWTITQSGTFSNTYTGSTPAVTIADLAPGTYTFTVGTATCTSVASTAVVISSATAAPTAPIAATPTQPTCTTTTASVVLSGLPSGNWTLNLGSMTIAGTGTTYTLDNLAQNATYSISVINSLGCESPATTVVINAAGETVNLADEACNGDDKLILNLGLKLPTGTPLNGVWTRLSDNTPVTALFNPFGLANGVYNIQYVVASGSCTQTFVVAVTVDSNLCAVSPCGNLVVNNAFSPNGDGLNDTFVITDLQETACYPTNSIEIYNRWGVLVYDTRQYDNNTRVFRGISEGRATLSKSSELPAGTYFYILKYTDSVGKNYDKQGYLYLSK
ncbi:gliding motility-associated C-terminal domain-containing protein, partial [Flavobacterium noncentrifugens]|uniref:gliding motility-associated C-terminal domain-containing protein n=1 Tax=Flavobacterium noncentrifugens TaxID=1128970 RepID=UPI0011BF69D1